MRFKHLLPILATLLPLSEGHGTARTPYATYDFGLTLMTGMNNELFTLLIVKEYEGRILTTEPMTRSQFVLEAQGATPSKANPTGLNLFLKYKVASCLPPEELQDGHHLMADCGIFDDLWKLRFWEYPFAQADGQLAGLGWSEERSAPSKRQLLLLSDYGMLELHSMVRGGDLFRLLHDIGDPEWVDNYRKGY